MRRAANFEMKSIQGNPVFWQEFTHQLRGGPRRTWYRVLLGPAILVLFVVIVVRTLEQPLFPTRELGIYAIWFVHIGMIIRGILAGANVISREHVGQTWDTLVLTGVSARQITLGKWRAALDRAAPWMLALGTIRAVMVPVFMMALTVYTAHLATDPRSQRYFDDFNAADLRWVPWAQLLAVACCVVFTVVDFLGATALGMATSAMTRNHILAVVSALCIRFAPIALFAGFTRYSLGDQRSQFAYTVLRFPFFGLADSGTAPISRLSVPFTPLSLTTHQDALYGLLLSFLMIVIILLISLIVAWIGIRNSGALPKTQQIADAQTLMRDNPLYRN